MRLLNIIGYIMAYIIGLVIFMLVSFVLFAIMYFVLIAVGLYSVVAFIPKKIKRLLHFVAGKIRLVG